MNLFLVRHGQTEGNLAGRLIGWRDIELTREGERQAQLTAAALFQYAAAEELRIHAIYSSPLRRALNTALAIGSRFGLDPIVEPDLREINFGDIEGFTVQEWRERYPELAAAAVDAANRGFAWPGGETRAGFYERAVGVVDRLVGAHAEDENIIVVSHGGVISSVVAYISAGDPALWRDYPAGNCSITRLTVTGGRADSPGCLVSFNDVAHLGDVVQEVWSKET